jgi:hypothetical protein
MTMQQLITWMAYHWEFGGLGVTLLAVAYGAVLDARDAHHISRAARRG